MSAPAPTKVLLIGLGELGSAILTPLSALPNTHITVGVRSPSKHAHLASSPTVSLLELDITSPSADLAFTFSQFDILISATGYGQKAGGTLKLAREALDAAALRKQRGQGKLWFFPWQFGLDFDVTGDVDGLMPVFGVQKAVRDLLRGATQDAEEAHIKFTIVSTGLFMSFLFQDFWGVVSCHESRPDAVAPRVVVTAIRDPSHKVTTTHVGDIGRVVAALISPDCKVDSENKTLYLAGDTLSYADFAHLMTRVTGRQVGTEVWTTEFLRKELEKDPMDVVKRYRVAFAGEGMYWDRKKSVHEALGVHLVRVDDYAKKWWEERKGR
ncbi:hypothetical protein ACEQ8H_008452 [Pleosporales sp. CAS-2024a]